MKKRNPQTKEPPSEVEIPPISKTNTSHSKNVFFALWLGQFISLVGTDITKFALRIWTYQRTQSVGQYALITFFSEMPAILLSPIAGTFVDRYSRKWIMVFADSASAISTFILCLSLYFGQLETWHIYLSNCIQSMCNAFQWTAFTASMALLVPKEELGKYGGMNQMAPALSMLIGPGIAGALISSIQMQGIFFIEFFTFFIGFSITLSVSIPNPSGKQESKSILSDIGVAWSFIRTRPGLIGLLCFLALGQFSSGLVQVLLTPLILNFSTPTILGSVLSLSGTGALAGSILLSAWGGPHRKVFGVLGCAFMQGILLASCGLAPNASLILFVAFSYMFFIPLVRTCRESIWQRKAPVEIQGRIFATQRMIAQIALPLAAVISGPLADKYFEPMFMPEGLLADSIGRIIGTGAGRGVAFLFVILGLTNALASVAGLLFSPLRRVDIDLPDAH